MTEFPKEMNAQLIWNALHNISSILDTTTEVAIPIEVVPIPVEMVPISREPKVAKSAIINLRDSILRAFEEILNDIEPESHEYTDEYNDIICQKIQEVEEQMNRISSAIPPSSLSTRAQNNEQHN